MESLRDIVFDHDEQTLEEQRAWLEDLPNGNYLNLCTGCDRTFAGFEWRSVCKVCSDG